MKWMSKLEHSFCMILVFVSMLSCQKQSSPQIASEETKSSREIKRLDACSKVNFSKGVLLYQNMLELFVCSKWNEEFPHMFTSIQTMSAESWDHMMAPIDETFVENQQRRDRVFKNIRELDSKGGLDDLSYVLTALNETNFFDSTKILFLCVENPLDPQCSSRVGRVPEKKSLKNIIRLVEVTPDSIDNLSFFIKMLIKSMDGQQENFRTEVNKIRTSPIYIPTRLRLINTFFTKINSGLSEEDRLFLSKVLLIGNQKGDSPWIYQWIQDLKMNRDKFRDLIEYPVLTNPEFISEIQNLKKAYDNGLSCSIKNTTAPNELVEFSFKSYISNYADVIRNRGQKDFYDFSSSGVAGLKMSTEICRELESNQYNVNLIKILTHFANFLGERKYYDLVKFLITQSTATGDPGKTFAENLYLFDMVANEIFSSANVLNSLITSNTRNFYPVVFDIAKNFSPPAYAALGEFTKSLLQVDNDSKMKGMADVWSFFTPEEKNFFFNFIDRHFDKDKKFLLLLDFYTKIFDEWRDVHSVFTEKWIGTSEQEEKTYLALQDVLSNLSGADVLSDFKKFFSRNQILKVMEIISNGKEINKNAIAELKYIYSDSYLARSKDEQYAFKIKYDPGSDKDYDAKLILECMDKFSDVQNGFYELIRRLPTACTRVTNENIAFRVYGWMNAIDESYSSFKQNNNSSNSGNYKDSLFDQNGMLSPMMLNASVGTAKIIDDIIGPIVPNVSKQKGISYLLSSIDYYLNQHHEYNGALLIDHNLQWLSSFLDVIPGKNIQHRNALLKSFTGEDNFTYSANVFNNLGKVFTDYGRWIQAKGLEYAKQRFEKANEEYSCEKTINQFISPNPCPSAETVKSYGNSIIFSLQNIFEQENGSPVAMLMKALKVGEGLDIPLNGQRRKKFRLSLKDTFNFLYDSSDKSFAINKLAVNFVRADNTASRETVTTLERVESVIREVDFDNNYLGVAFLNAVVQGDNYNADVAARKSLLQKCVKIPIIRCSRQMSASDLRMALNSLEVFDALSDVNNGRGLDPRLQYGDYLKTFEQTLVASSATAAQKVQLFSLKDDLLVKHNGKILSNMTAINTLSNAARVIRDRVGRTRAEFNSFVNSAEFERVDRALLYGFDLPKASSSAERLLRTIYTSPTSAEPKFFNNTVDWIAKLNYQDTRLVEDTVARLMVVGSFLGPPEVVFKKEDIGNFGASGKRYANNNLFQIFLALEKIIDYWPTLKNQFPDVNFMDVVRPVNTALYFLSNQLNSIANPQDNTTYLALNDVFLALQTTLFDDVPNSNILEDYGTTKGLDFLLETFKDPSFVKKTYTMVNENYRYSDIFYLDSGAWFLTVGKNLQKMAKSPQVDLIPLRDFLSFTTKNRICQLGDTNCGDNYHYDEVANLIKFLNKKSDAGQSNFMLMNQRMFIENLDSISQMLDSLLPAIVLKKVTPPLTF